jgi:hypothetical protein
MPYTREQLDKMFSELPDEVKTAMTSVDTVEVLNEIKEKYRLHIDQIGQLSAEIALITAGAASPQSFVPSLEQLMGISRETANAIAIDVNEKMFKPIRNTLKNIQKEEVPEETTEMKPTETQKPIVTDPYREPI